MQFCWDDPGLAGKLLSCLPQSQLFQTKACFRRKLLGRTIRKQKQHPHNPRAQRDKMRLRKEALTSKLVFGFELVFEIRARNPQTTPKGTWMMLNLSSPRHSTRFGLLALICAFALIFSAVAFAQTTVSTGSIVGTVTDATGAVVTGARVTITKTDTNQAISVSSNSAGAYNSGALAPGNYKVQVSAKGFSTSSETVVVQVGNTATANMKLQVGQESTVIEVQASEVQVNTEQATVQGVLTASQIENLPVNGRNFLDLAQLEPGVQIQDGTNFDPTKVGYSSISFGGRFGRSARIEVDGLDVSDETVGTTTQNIPASGIQEFQIEQSSLDLSTELTSSGAVNVTTKSGTNRYHGEGYYAFRDQTLDANLPGGTDNPFQRNQYGGDFGGPILKDKLFFFLDAE